MKKEHFTVLVVCVIAGLLFSLGMCMCLLPEWDLFTLGIVLTVVGGATLLILGFVFYMKNAKNRAPINWKFVGKITYGVISALILGLGMCFVMVWQQIIVGIIVGVIGLVMLLFLIPMLFGFKK